MPMDMSASTIKKIKEDLSNNDYNNLYLELSG